MCNPAHVSAADRRGHSTRTLVLCDIGAPVAHRVGLGGVGADSSALFSLSGSLQNCVEPLGDRRLSCRVCGTDVGDDASFPLRPPIRRIFGVDVAAPVLPE